MAPRYAAALAAGRVLQWSAFATWAYVAAMAVIAPMYLRLNFEGVLPVGTDTFGDPCLCGERRPSLVNRPPHRSARVQPQAHSWYSQCSQVRRISRRSSMAVRVRQQHLSSRHSVLALDTLLPWPSEGTFAVTCFIVGIISGIVYFVLRALSKEGPTDLGPTEVR